MLKNILMILIYLLPTFLFCAEQKYIHKETKDLVNMVDSAALAVERYGERVFPQFRKKGSFWYKEDKYIFVDDMDGVEVVNPAFPSLEGKNIMDIQDKWGKYIVKDYIREVYRYGKNKPYGWFHYLWPKADNGEIVWKTTYVTKATAPSGNTYLVGSGGYDMKMEKVFMMDAVNDAVEAIKKYGLEKAIRLISSKEEEFFYNDTYVFVVNDKAQELANKVFPNLPENQNFWKIQDMERKYIFKEFLNTAKDKGEGWVIAAWPPEGSLTVPKYVHTYVKAVRVQDQLIIVGTSAVLEISDDLL